MTTTPALLAFAWTATSGYKHYPPYVNLTGNRLAVRAPEDLAGEYPQPGACVAVDLPDEAINALRSAMSARSPVGWEEVLTNLYEAGEARRVRDFDPNSRVTVLETRTKDIVAFHEALDEAADLLQKIVDSEPSAQ